MMPKALSLLLTFIFLLLTMTSGSAQDDYPTVTALNSAEIPPRDRVALAQRFYDIGEIPLPPSSAPERSVGDRETFWVTNTADENDFQVTAVLRGIGEHIYIWVDERSVVSDDEAQGLAEAFDTHIYDEARELWGSEPNPGIDGDPRVHALFAFGIGSGTGGYFASDYLIPTAVLPTSNQREMFVFNLDALPNGIDNFTVEALLAHEFQHMIRANVDNNEDTWMDEGFSMFTELFLGYSNPWGAASSFLATPRTQLNAWSEEGPRTPNYGAAMLFIAYLYERYGLTTLQEVSADHANGMIAVENVLGGEEVHNLLADWTIANALLLPDSGYGYNLLPPDMNTALPLEDVSAYPYYTTGTANQYSADYYVLEGFSSGETLDISLTMPVETQLIPTAAYSGSWMWYSNKGDNSDTTLTRAFDLTGVTSATLNYRVWYHIENLWDYGYILVSTDNGATWEVLPTAYTTTENPHNNAYGAGYSGQSFGWLYETISLDAYAGQQILLRFEMITDDSIAQPGMAIDDVSIPEIGYFSDFESDGGGWDAAGWIHIDNRLPQSAWVQVVQQTGENVEVTRWLATDSGMWTITLDTAEQVMVMITPFAPVTVVPMSYTLNIDRRSG